KPEGADEYFDEIGADDAVKHAFAELPGNPPLHRSYNKHTKTFFCVKTCTTGREVSFVPVGQALEFVAMKSNQHSFKLLRNGKPLAEQAVSVVSSDGHKQALVTDHHGVVKIKPSDAGPMMLLSVWITMPEHADGVYHSDYATLTVDLARGH
ncbi:hypothetical protein MNBD_ALPHA06-1000, partial [hydrothermal vent metagenome]